jgi:hypothetical protein
MEKWHEQQMPPADGLAEQRTSNELVKLIRKLRWMGMEEEAERAQDELTVRRTAADSVVASPRDTD